MRDKDVVENEPRKATSFFDSSVESEDQDLIEEEHQRVLPELVGNFFPEEYFEPIVPYDPITVIKDGHMLVIRA